MKIETKQVVVVDDSKTGELARMARIAKGLPLREVARRLSVSAAYISDLERGRRSWSEDRMQKYRKALESS